MRSRKRRFGREDGQVFLAAIICLVVLMGVTIGIMSQALHHGRVSEASYQLERTLYIAEAGVDAAAFELLQEQDGNLGEAFAGGHYTVNTYNLLETLATNGIDDDGDGEIDEADEASETDAEGNMIMRITSVGQLNQYQQALEVDVRVFIGGGWDYIVMVRHQINLTGNCETNSYNSSLVDYPEEQLLGNGNISTNSTGFGIIDVSGSANINGDARVGFAGNPEWGIDVTGSASITGDKAALQSEIEIPSVEVPDFEYDEVGDIILTGSQQRTLAPGNYYAPIFELSSQSVLNLGVGYEGEINIVAEEATLRGYINIPGNVNVNIYVTDSLYVIGPAEINDPNATDIRSTPSNLSFFGTPTLAEAEFTGNSRTFATLYAPDTDITIIGNAEFMGAIVASNVFVGQGNARFYRDEDIILDLIDANYPVGVRSVSWREIAPS